MVEEIHRVTVNNPNELDYNLLDQMYSDQLSCPCTSISTNYSSFINIEPQYHQLCSSDLVSTAWMNYHNNYDYNLFYPIDDYRIIATGYFQLLSMFCQYAHQTIDTALQIYLQNQFVSSRVVSKHLFESQINSSIRNWQSSMIERYFRTIELVEVMHLGNQLVSGAVILRTYIDTDPVVIVLEAMDYGNECFCALSRSCRSLTQIYDLDVGAQESIPFFSIPNFFIGCLPVEALFQSTLECFYNQSCMLEIDQYMYSPSGFSILFFCPRLKSKLAKRNCGVDRQTSVC